MVKGVFIAGERGVYGGMRKKAPGSEEDELLESGDGVVGLP